MAQAARHPTVSQAPAPTDRLDKQHPWPGLRSFTESDSTYFYGREEESSALQTLVDRAPVVVLYGQSGLGKTSLLRAGVFPRLAEAGYVPVWIRLDWSATAPPPTQQVLQALHAALNEAGVEAPPPRADDSLWAYFHRTDADFWGPRNRLVTPLLVLDQFEELFTLGQRDAGAAVRTEAFIADLEAQFEQRPPAAVRQRLEAHPEEALEYDMTRENVRFVISLREDFLPHLDAWRERLPSMLARRYRLEAMTRQQALQVVQEAGSELVSDAVAQDIVSYVAAGGADPRVEPAILSVVCNELNLRRMRAGLPQITRELLSGERSRIIADFYERSFNGIPDAARAWVEDELLTAGGHRDRAALDDARRAGIDDAHLMQLVDRRILHSDERNNVQWIEFTHDLLTGPASTSRTDRQQRQAQAEAERREAEATRREQEVRSKLRRSRALSAVFGLMALVMTGGAWWLKMALGEVRIQTEKTALALDAAQDARGKAETAQREAERALDAADKAASAAGTEAARATKALEDTQRAEALARSNLGRAQQSALATVDMAATRLKEQWIKPAQDSVNIVRASLASTEPVSAQFGDMPEMRTARVQLLAVAALIHHERYDEADCTRLARQAEQLAAPGLPANEQTIEARALSHLASGNCLRLIGQFTEAGQRMRNAMDMAARLPPGNPLRARLRVLASVGIARAAQARYDFPAARQALSDASTELAARPTGGPTGWEANDLALAVAALRASLTGGTNQELIELDTAGALLKAMPADQRDTLAFRDRDAALKVDRAWSLFLAQRTADADDLAREAAQALELLLDADPKHVQRQVLKAHVVRLRAEIQLRWTRVAAGLAYLDALRTTTESVLRQEPRLAVAAYHRNLVGLLVGQKTNRPLAERRQQLQDALAGCEALIAAAPEYAVVRRTKAIALQAMSRLVQTESEDAKLNADARSTLQSRAVDLQNDALRVLDGLAHASTSALVADVSASAELAIGDLELERRRPAAAMEAFTRSLAWRRRVTVPEAERIDRAIEEAVIQQRMARSLREQDRTADAATLDKEVVAAMEALRSRHPESFALIDSEAWTHRMAAIDLLKKGELTASVASATAAAQLLFKALQRDPLSKPAEDSLGAVMRFALDNLQPQINAAKDPALREALSKLFALRGNRAVNALNDDRVHAPLLAGNWEHFHRDRLPIDSLGLAKPVSDLKTAGWRVVGARRMALGFYRDSHLVELDLTKSGTSAAVAGFVVRPGREPVRLTGKTEVITSLNDSHELDLGSQQQASQYLRFNLQYVDWGRGRVRPIEQPGDLLWHPDAVLATRTAVGRRVEPLEIRRTATGDWTAQGTVQLGGRLYQAKLSFSRTGSVTFPRDNDVGGRDLPIASETYRDAVRVIDDSHARPGLLDQAVDLARQKKDWASAASSQAELVKHTLQATAESSRAEVLPNLYLQLSWYELLNAVPAKALQSTEAGLALDADHLPLLTNKAHALLLSGRQEDAMALYRQNIGRKMPTASGRLWEDEILNDLRQFENNGLRDPRLATVKALMDGAKATTPGPKTGA